MNTNDDYDFLKEKGHRSTPGRRAVINLLITTEKPVTADEIYRKLAESDCSPSLATVYRTLDFLMTGGFINRSFSGMGDSACYEYNRGSHTHKIICRSCRKTYPLSFCPLSNYEEMIKNETHFVITGHNLEIFGFCPDCS